MREDERPNRNRARVLRRELTKAEAWLWIKLRRPADSNLKFRRQHRIGPYIADFANVAAHLIVEVDGATHSTDEEIAYDARRTSYLAREGWRVIRFTNDEIFKGLDQVVDAIIRAVER